MKRTWRQRTPYIAAYNELRQKHYDDIKELKQKVHRMESMIEYMAAHLWPIKEEK